MTIREVANYDVVALGRDDSVLEAARWMRDQHVGCVVVVDEPDGRRVPIGLLTDRDIVVAVIALDLEAEEVSIGDVMSDEIHAIAGHEGIADALEVMRSKGVRRLPVVDSDGRLEGIVSADDLVGILADEIGSLAHIVAREQIHEHEKRRVKV